MKAMTFYFIIVAVSLLTGCSKEEATPRPPSSPPSPQEYEEKAKEHLKKRNEREGTSFNVEDDAARMRQEYTDSTDEKKNEMFNKVSR